MGFHHSPSSHSPRERTEGENLKTNGGGAAKRGMHSSSSWWWWWWWCWEEEEEEKEEEEKEVREEAMNVCKTLNMMLNVGGAKS